MTNISKSPPVSVTKTHVQTDPQPISISWIWKCPLSHSRTFLTPFHPSWPVCLKNLPAAKPLITLLNGRKFHPATRRCGTGLINPTCATRLKCRLCPIISADPALPFLRNCWNKMAPKFVRSLPQLGQPQIMRPHERIRPERGPARHGLYFL